MIKIKYVKISWHFTKEIEISRCSTTQTTLKASGIDWGWGGPQMEGILDEESRNDHFL